MFDHVTVRVESEETQSVRSEEERGTTKEEQQERKGKGTNLEDPTSLVDPSKSRFAILAGGSLCEWFLRCQCLPL
jgi:hypothetical protein